MKIAILTPHYGDVKAGFAFSLANMISRTASTRIAEGHDGPLVKAFRAGGTNIIDNRERLVAMARDWQAEFILWVDADHTFPTDALIRLLRRGKRVVGC